MIRKIFCNRNLVAATLKSLREAGKENTERVVLWLAKQNEQALKVEEIFLPIQFCSSDMFRIPPKGMSDLLSYLRTEKFMVAAQVHSHPYEAFHSLADDRWAIIKHIGAVSIVIPYFGAGTNPENFLTKAASFAYSENGAWERISMAQIDQFLEVSNC